MILSSTSVKLRTKVTPSPRARRSFGLSELYHGHPRPARHDFRDIGGGYLAGNPGVLLLPMAALLFQLLGEFLLFVPQMRCV